MAVTSTVAALGYAAAVSAGSLAVVVPIASLSPVISVILGWLILHEKITRLQAAGLLFAMVRVALVTS